MKEYSYRIKSLTPIFSYGASDNPEIRPASIRGMLRWWFRALKIDPNIEKSIMGFISSDSKNKEEAKSSKVIIRVDKIPFMTPIPIKTLPHVNYDSNKKAYQNASFSLSITERRPLSDEERDVLIKVIEAWLLMGSLGGRSTRGGGSIASIANKDFSFESLNDWNNKAKSLLANTEIKAELLQRKFDDSEAGRLMMSATAEIKDQEKLKEHRHPLGSIKPRKSSPLKFKLVEIANAKYIAAIWDGRDNTDADLKFAIEHLSAKGKPIGGLLKTCNLYKNL